MRWTYVFSGVNAAATAIAMTIDAASEVWPVS